ncbi:winged helix-turn-helix transcriptional regulator [Paraburkholderia fynbosensis]|uniref:Putative HTH-type transcriptional regulator n=1 Tax=Paraburkholderia fynbosensis TaxID=1200993 RepID=A0A6J5GRM1_9BURK|nr:helix-turn-helix domain-containing protein [Paraburkholderia fynbosensis]CAB3805756.1 putative HTH-type transcriptional regulator [Paraburkholderia fynbosensis]
MSWDEVCDSVCPIARSLAVVGDRWTLLILRELAMGTRRFDEIQAQTGMSSFLLSSRLKRLEKDGVVERRPYSDRPPRFEYHTTEKGKDLDGVLLLLRAWDMKWGRGADEEPAVHMVHKRTGKVVDAAWRPPATGKPFSFDDVNSTVSSAFAAEREARRTAFLAAKRGDDS